MFGMTTGAGSTVAGIVIGAVAGNPLYRMVIGVVVGMLLLAGFATRAVIVASAGDPALLEGQGAIDVIRCGDGTDFVEASPGDRVAADCERVERPQVF